MTLPSGPPSKVVFSESFYLCKQGTDITRRLLSQGVEADPQQNSISPATGYFLSKSRVLYTSAVFLTFFFFKEKIFHCINVFMVFIPFRLRPYTHMFLDG